MNLSHLVRSLVSRLPASLLVLAAAVGFYVLTRGTGSGSQSAMAYADAQRYSIAAVASGRLAKVLVTVGQPIKAGEPLAALEDGPLLRKRQRLVAELEQAKGQLAAEKDLQAAALSRGEVQVARLRVSSEKERAELAELNKELERLEALAKEQLVKASELEAIRRRKKSAEAAVAAQEAAAHRDHNVFGRQVRSVEDQDRHLVERLQPFQQAIQVREAALAELDGEIGALTLRAPCDGVVGALLHRPGEVVLAGQEVLSVVAAIKGRVIGYFPERAAGKVAPGQGVRLRRLGSFAHGILGKVVAVAPSIEELPPRARPTANVPIWGRMVVIEVVGESLLPGESFHVQLAQ